MRPLPPTGALAVFLKSQGVRFSAEYTSPLDRVRATALSIFQELQFSEEQIQPSDALVEMSQGHCQKSEIFTPEMVSLMERTQRDFSAPSGESLRQITISTSTIQHIGNHFSTGTVKWGMSSDGDAWV